MEQHPEEKIVHMSPFKFFGSKSKSQRPSTHNINGMTLHVSKNKMPNCSKHPLFADEKFHSVKVTSKYTTEFLVVLCDLPRKI
jgi:hypothetical protein